jgi:tetratricopeptide (TPR) repeat protein
MSSVWSRMLAAVVVLVTVSATASYLPAQGSPTAYIGNDIPGLREALKKEPSNLGLRMRIIRRLLDRVRESDRVQESKNIFRQLEEEMAELIEQKPAFPYPYRVLARLYYRRGDYEKILSLYRDYQDLAPLDQEMRSLYTKSLLRLATDEEKPQPERLKEAADFVGNWFDSGDAPSFGKTLGVCSAWLREEGFRDELVASFERRYAANPKNLNLVISYASILSALGRNESAWKIVQDAEKVGLCDSVTGARHPVAYLLEMNCPEVGHKIERDGKVVSESYDGMLIEEFEARMKDFPENVALPLRAALVYKRRADSASQLEVLFENRAKTLAKEDKPASRDDAAKFEKKAGEFGAEAEKNFRLALPLAQRAYELNPQIESTALLLGDIHFKLKQYDEAERFFRRGLEMVPLFADLREGLARVYIEKKDWKRASVELAEICKVLPCDAANWNETEDELLPEPKASHERLVVDLARNAQARGELVRALEASVAASPGNPNVATYLAMVHYFAGNRSEAVRWSLAAEKSGICGEKGFQFYLSTFILERERW